MAALSSSSTPSITLTTEEQDFFELCLEAADRAGKGTVIRVAGGWVRDKLLGTNNDDIDLAVDNVSGETFGHHLNQHLAAVKRQGSPGAGGRLNGIKVAVIKANPGQSKHLETATVKFAGLEIDITNLRTETYSDDSRIPEMQFGTAEEDAFRRDLTINTLFYNINTSSVEDLTGRGLSDLREGRVVTPLAPFETFKDDPLRILRAVRFAHRFQFAVDPEIAKAAKHPAIVEALVCKVSRERFGKEVEGMLKRWPTFPAALRDLHEMGLLPLLLTTNPEATAAHARAAAAAADDATTAGGGGGGGSAPQGGVSAASWEGALGSLDWLAWLLDGRAAAFAQGSGAAAGAGAAAESGTMDAKAVAQAAMLAGAVQAYAGVTLMTGKKRNKPAAAAALQEGLKLRNKDCDASALIVESASRFAQIAQRLAQPPSTAQQDVKSGAEGGSGAEPLRVELGLLLRDLKQLWRPALAHAAALALRERAGPAAAAAGDSLAGDSAAAVAVAGEYEAVARAVASHGLDGCWAAPPLVNGKALASALGLAPGPRIGRAMALQVRWQLEHPKGSAEECLKALKAAHQKPGN